MEWVWIAVDSVGELLGFRIEPSDAIEGEGVVGFGGGAVVLLGGGVRLAVTTEKPKNRN
jgi:hypothetical protein